MKNKQQKILKNSNKKTIKKTLTMSGIAVMAATAGMVSTDDAKADDLKKDDQLQSQTTTLNSDNDSTTVTLKPQNTYLSPEMLAESKTVMTDEGATEPTVEQEETQTDNSNMNITPISTAAKGDVTPADANWKFNGTFNATVATVDYHKSGSTKPAGTLDVSGISRVPNENFGDSKYFAITVKRGDTVLYDNQRVGNERGTKFAESLNLQPGDIIELYHAEPGRLVVNDDASMKQTSVVNKQRDYAYQVAQDLSLVNISDYAYLDRKVRGFFTSDKKDALSFGVQQPNLDDLKQLLNDQKTKLTAEQKQKIQDNLDKAQALLDKAPGALPLNQTQTKDFYVLPKSVSIDTTQKETRYLGTNQDRQDLGLVLQNGGKIRVRQTNPDYKGNVQVQMIGDSTQKMTTTNVGSDWVEITANGDQVPFLYTAKSDDPTQPRLEYEVIEGTAKELPVFDSTSDQTKVLDQWNTTRVPFALIETNNIQLLVPSNDMQRIKDMDVKGLINQYDNELFSLYDDLSGLPKNTDKNHPVKGRYFAFADNTGEASGVWYPNRITQNGRSVSGYLNIGWLALHEIAHGYEVTSNTMKTFESFNNIYGAIYQTKHLDNFVKDSWIFSGGKDATINTAVSSVLDENKTWKDLDLRTRLVYWLDLAKNLRDEEAFTKFNTLHQEIAKNGGDIGDLGRAWTETYADNYQLNVASFFDTLGVPMDEATEMNNYNKLPAVAILAQVVPEDKIADVIKQLGWNDKDTPLQSKASLVTNEDLKKTGLKSHITLNITNPDEIKGTTLSIMDGDKVIKTVPVNGATVDLGELPNGVYTFKSSDPTVSFEDKYLYVKEDKTVDETVKKDADILEAVKSLFTDDTYTKLKDTVTLDQINEAQKGVDVIENPELKAKNQALVDKAKSLINEFVPKGYDGPFVSYRYLNNDGVLRINTFHREPNYRRGGVKHTTVTVTDKDGNVKYTKTYLGSDMLDVGEDTIQLAPGDKINIKTPFDGMQTVYPDELQDGSNLKDITYEVTPDLKLRLPNEAPVIDVEQEQLIFPDDGYDPISPEWVYSVHDREDGDIELTYENVVTNVNPDVPGIYHTKYTVVDSEGKRTSVIVNVRVESYDGEEGEDHPLTPEELAQGEPEVPVKEETPTEETKPEEQPSQETPAEETKPEEQPGQDTPTEETKPEEQPGQEAPAEETKPEEQPGQDTPTEETKPEEQPAETPTEETKPEEQPAETPTEETKPEEQPGQEVPTEETKPEEQPGQETPAEETKPEEQPSQETPAEETKPEEQPSQETPTEETKPEEQPAETPTEETKPEEQPSQEVPTEETKPEEQPGQEAPTEETKPEEQPSQEVPTEETKPEEQPAEKPAEETKPEEQPGQEAPTEETKPEEQPSQEVPTEETKPEEQPGQEVPVEETKPEEQPAETPAEETKPEEQPAETPAEETKPEEQPSQEVPAEETKPEEQPAETPTEETKPEEQPSQEVPTEETKPEVQPAPTEGESSEHPGKENIPTVNTPESNEGQAEQSPADQVTENDVNAVVKPISADEDIDEIAELDEETTSEDVDTSVNTTDQTYVPGQVTIHFPETTAQMKRKMNQVKFGQESSKTDKQASLPQTGQQTTDKNPGIVALGLASVIAMFGIKKKEDK